MVAACQPRRKSHPALQRFLGELDCWPAYETMAAVFKLSLPASLLATCLLAASAVSPAFAQSFSTLEERMSAAQFRAAGLDKLSPEELAALNAWLQKNVGIGNSTAVSSAPAAMQDRIGLRDETSQGTVTSRLLGQFRGWQGKTSFHLENGQVWQQVGNDKWAGVTLENPAVTIKPAFMGSWSLKVEGYNTSTKVKRIK